MRIALLTNFIPPYRVPLYEALTREAGELAVFISTAMESNRAWQVDWGRLDVVQQRTLTLRRKWRTQSFAEDYELHIPYDTVAQLRRYRPDVIITGEMGARSMQAALYARATRTPLILWAMISDRLEQMRGMLRRGARKWLLRNVDAIVTNGEDGARYFLRMGVPDDRILRVNQAVDLSAFLALPLAPSPSDALRLLHVGTLSERKGVVPFMRALHAWAASHPEKRSRLTLVGDGPLRAELQAMPLPANLETHWAGPVQYDVLPQWYAQGDILAFPTLGDEWGLVVNEALGAGVPVLGSAYSQAVEERVRDGENGWVFRPDDERSAAAALDRALSVDAGELQRMRTAARASVADLTPENAAARIVQRARELRAP